MNGIIYSISGDPEIPKLLMSVKALRAVSDIPFIVNAYLTPSGYDTLDKHQIPYIQNDDIKDIDSTDLKDISRYLKTSVHRVSPFNISMYFDNDIIPVLDPKWVFDLVPESGIIFGHDAGKTVKKFSRYACPKRDLANEIYKNFNVKVNKDWHIWNGGLFVFDNRGHEFLDSWHNKQLKVIKGINGWTKRDQGTLITTIWEFGLQNQQCLPPEANFLHGLQSGLRYIDGKWVHKNTGKLITNIHLCLAWGKKTSDTWKKLDRQINGEKLGSPKPIPPNKGILIEDNKHTLPFKLMLESITSLEDARFEDKGQCTDLNVKFHGRWDNKSAVVLYEDKTIIINYSDLVNLNKSKLSKDNLPDLILKCQYRDGHTSYSEYDCKIVPFTYPTVNSHVDNDYLLTYRDRYLSNYGKYEYVAFGRLAKHGPRVKLAAVVESIPGVNIKLIGMNKGKHQIGKSDGRLSKDEYFNNMASSVFCLDGPGGGNLTHRIIEAWAMCQPVICPILKNSFYVPVLPDIHYIPVKHDYSDLADKIKHYTVNFDKAMVIAKNGADYYDKYCNKLGIAKLFLKILRENLS